MAKTFEPSIQEILLARGWRILADMLEKTTAKTITAIQIRNLALKLDSGKDLKINESHNDTKVKQN